jgi:hypothetical protein
VFRIRRALPSAALLVTTALGISGCDLMLRGYVESSLGHHQSCRYGLNLSPCAGTSIAPERRIRYLAITGTLSLDGIPVVYNELLQVKDVVSRTRASDVYRATSLPQTNRDLIAKRVGKGALAMRIFLPKQDDSFAWDGTPRGLESQRDDGPTVLQFYWKDDPESPKRRRWFKSVDDFAQPDAPIQVIEPLRFCWIEPTPDVAAESAAQAENTPVRTAFFPRIFWRYPVADGLEAYPKLPSPAECSQSAES